MEWLGPVLRTVASEEEAEEVVTVNASVITLVRFVIIYINLSLILDKNKGDTNGDRDILDLQWTKRLSCPVSNPFLYVIERAEKLFPIAYASIGTDLNEPQNTSWIATSYLLTTTSIQ